MKDIKKQKKKIKTKMILKKYSLSKFLESKGIKPRKIAQEISWKIDKGIANICSGRTI